jgi:hypothetical protein
VTQLRHAAARQAVLPLVVRILPLSELRRGDPPAAVPDGSSGGRSELGMRGSHIGRPQEDARAESETVVDRDPAVGDPLPPAVVLATLAATVGAAFHPVRQDGLGGHPGNDRILPADQPADMGRALTPV